jgi:thymidylate kinase
MNERPGIPQQRYPASQSSAWARLHSCLVRLQQGPWKFIQLRGEALDEDAIDGDDIDLLGTRTSVNQLLEAAFAWVRAGECHLRVSARTPHKVALTFFSHDGRHSFDLDLWIELWQINNRTSYLDYACCASIVTDPTAVLQRLPIELEAAIYLHHLISKRKDLAKPGISRRLAQYATQCREINNDILAEALENTATTRRMDEAARMLAAHTVRRHLAVPAPVAFRRKWRKIRDEYRAAWLAAPRKTSILSLMGCDGSGKTTMAHKLMAQRSEISGVLTGKHLYRKSWFYKLLVIFIRPLMLQDREKFDETFAPLAYTRACLGLQLKLWRRKRGLLLMDRSLADFLFMGRKSEQPGFGRSRWLLHILGRRIPVVHFVMPFECIQERKQEMTRTGHEIYDTAMFQHYTRLAPVDYMVFDNQGDLEASAAALDRIIGQMLEAR